MVSSAKSPALSEIAYEHILERIVSFVFKPGHPIIEEEICGTLEISRTPLREALRRLEAEGFVHKVRNRGTFVRNISYEDIREICDIRKVFELYAMRNCVGNAPEADILEVKAMLDVLGPDSPDEAYFQSDKSLHALIMRYCMNSRMVSYTRSLDAQLGMIRVVSAHGPKRLQHSQKEHLAIVEAMLKEDCELAVTLLESHLDNVKKSTLASFNEMRMDLL